jgi:hypothetical protein
MRIIGCDLHARQQTRGREGDSEARRQHGARVYDHLARPVRVWIEATRSMQWFVNLMEELGIECLVDHPAEIRAADLFRLNSQNWKTERMIWRRPIPG